MICKKNSSFNSFSSEKSKIAENADALIKMISQIKGEAQAEQQKREKILNEENIQKTSLPQMLGEELGSKSEIKNHKKIGTPLWE